LRSGTFSKTRLAIFATVALHVFNFFSLDFSWRLMQFLIELNMDDENNVVLRNLPHVLANEIQMLFA
jgi:hypothetical protein